MRNWFGLLVVAAWLAAAPAEAGWSFRQSVRISGQGDARDTINTSTVQIEEGDARIDFEEVAGNPMFAKGGYILLRGSEPKGMFIVNPEAKTYTKFDPAGLAQAMAPMAQAMEGSGFAMTVADAKLVKLVDEPGEEMLGLATKHIRTRRSYVMTMEMANMKMPTAHDVIDDVWLTQEISLGSADLGEAMGSLSGAPAFAGLRQLAELEQEILTGFPLKRVTVDHSVPQGKGMMARMMGGKEQTVTITMEVQDLQKVRIPPATFAIPAGYSETQMMQPGAPAPDLEDEE